MVGNVKGIQSTIPGDQGDRQEPLWIAREYEEVSKEGVGRI